VFAGAVDATFAAFGLEAVYTPAGGDPVPVRVIARRPDTIVGFGDTRIHAGTAIFELRASEVANPRPGHQLTVGGDTFVIQGEPERRDPDRLVWSVARSIVSDGLTDGDRWRHRHGHPGARVLAIGDLRDAPSVDNHLARLAGDGHRENSLVVCA
jgi:hypothetical protein